jgi:hypothetical protein
MVLLKFFIFSLLLGSTCIKADIHVGVGNEITQITEKALLDNTKGNLTSFLTPNFSLNILANLNLATKLNFYASLNRPTFQSPSGRNLEVKSIFLSNYGTGLNYLINKNNKFIFNFEIIETPFYSFSNQSSIFLEKSQNISFQVGYFHQFLDPLEFSIETLALFISPLKKEYDVGKISYGVKINFEKKIFSENDFHFFADLNLGYNAFPTKNIELTKEDIGIKLMVKIPIKSKELL